MKKRRNCKSAAGDISIRSPRLRGTRGAALVEFALVLLPLLVIVFGIIEFGWAYAQMLDVKHGAREGARIASVNYSDDENDIVEEICLRMGAETDGSVKVTLTRPSPAPVGSKATVVVTKPYSSLTNFFDFITEGTELDSTLSFRIEQEPGWSSVSGVSCGS